MKLASQCLFLVKPISTSPGKYFSRVSIFECSEQKIDRCSSRKLILYRIRKENSLEKSSLIYIFEISNLSTRWTPYVFQVALFQLADVTLMISVYNRKRMAKKKEMVGWFSLGLNSSGAEELAHWMDMKEFQQQQILRWHVLVQS